jgi:hypothetical protein
MSPIRLGILQAGHFHAEAARQGEDTWSRPKIYVKCPLYKSNISTAAFP